jgi:hypothetical protein
MQDFETIEALDGETKNSISTLALSAVASYGFENLDDGVTLSLLQNTARIVYVEREGKGLGVYDFLKYLKETDPAGYQGFVTSFSSFSSLKDKLKSKLNTVEISDIDKESYSIILTAVVFGYSSIYSSVSDFWESFDTNQKSLFPKELLSRANLDSVFDSDYVKMRLSIINSESSVDSIINLLKYINVESLFTGEAVNAELMKDSEIQSYRISGKVNYFYGFDPSIVDCEQIEVDEATGFRFYPCNRVSVKPRALQFNQIITDGPYSRGGPSVADNGIKLLTSIKNSYYDSSRIEGVKILNQNAAVGPFFASYNSGWVFDEFSGERPVNLRGDVGFANSADTLKSFPDGAETGQYHFLGSYTFTTGTGVGQISKYSGFNPILLRLNDKDEQRIYSQLEVNLFDKQKRSGQLMAYAVSTDKDILTSFSTGETSQYPLLSIANHTPSIPFIGINLEFSSKTFNKKPAAKFNFGSLYFVPETASNPGGSFTTATDFLFTGFNFTGDYFDLSTGSIKFNKEIKNTQNFNPEEAFVNEPNPPGGAPGLISPQPGSRLLQKALGFSNYKDCITGIEGVKFGSHYGVEYKFIPILDLDGNVIRVLKPPEIEDEGNKHVKRIGDTGVLKYVTGFGPAGNISPLLSKRVFGPLESKTDQGLDGKDFNYKYLPKNYGKLSYAHVPALNPARYYSGLFASERRQFLYPSAKKIHDRNNNRYFPSQVKLSFMVEEEYSKSANGSLSRYGGNVQKTIGELSDYWVDQDFSHNNTVDVGLFFSSPVWSYNPLTNRNLNPHHQYLTGEVSILDGELVSGSLTTYSFATELGYGRANLSLPSTPITSSVKKEYSAELEMNYALPGKSLSDFLDHPEHSNKAFISTGDSEITINQVTQTGSVSYVTGWTEQINIDVNNGADPLFSTALDVNQNISGDSWNGFYLKSGTVYYAPGAPAFRDPSSDKVLVEASDNSSNLRLFLRNLKLFPAFVNNEQDINYESGSLTSSHFSSQRQKNNFSDVSLRVFEINAGSIFDKIPNDDTAEEVSSFTKNISLNIAVEKNILRTGKLYYAPELIDQSVTLPEVSEKEYKQIADLYPQLNGYTFYSGVDAYARMNSGYYIKYTESSNLKLTITSAEVKYDRFPASDELFEFHLTGKANFSGALSYLTQEESCVVTHGIKVEEKINALDKLQSDEDRFSHASPILKDRLGSISTFSFPTRQIRRRNKIISGQNTFINVNSSSPYYNNHFHMSVTPEFVYLSNESSILGSFSQDHLLFPDASMINSSSYDYVDVFPNGEEYRMDKVDKIYEVVESKRFYDSFFSDSKLNSGEFVEFLPTGASVNSNKDLESFFAANFSKISDLKLGEKGNLYITKMEDRSSDVSKLRSSMLTGA